MLLMSSRKHTLNKLRISLVQMNEHELYQHKLFEKRKKNTPILYRSQTKHVIIFVITRNSFVKWNLKKK